MRNLLALFKKQKPSVPKANNQSAYPVPEDVQRVWQEQEGLYYLFDTLKLSYRSVMGEVTIEKIPVTKLTEVIHNNLPMIAEGESYSVTICAISTEVSGESTRSKAIANAARFRAKENMTQALFQNAALGLDRNSDVYTQYDYKRGVARLNNISLTEFIEQLQTANRRAISQKRHVSAIKSDNFIPLFSKNELLTMRKFGV